MKSVSLMSMVLVCLACGQRPVQVAAAAKSSELPEPFWDSDNPMRPGHALAPWELQPAKSQVIKLNDAEQSYAPRHETALVAPRSGAAATPTRIVTGLYSYTYHQDSTTTLQPQDLTAFPVKALVPNPAGGFDTYPGTGHSDGTFSISGVPVGNYWLAIGRQFTWTSNDHVEWVLDLYGRADANYPTTPPSDLIVNATNLSPWQATDELQYAVPSQGLITSLTGFATPPATGATSLSSYKLDFYNLGLPLLDASRGDQAYLTQLTTRSLGSTTYRALGKILNVPAVTMPDATDVTVNSGFLDAPQGSSLRLNWKRSALAAMAAQVNPSASVTGTEIGLWVTPLGLNMGVPGTAFQLLTDDSGATDATTDVDYGDAAYGNPFPASWSLLAETYFVFSTSYLAPGATTPVQMLRSAYTATNTLPTATAPIAPQVGPVTNPRINGKDLFSNQVAVGTSPVLAWDPPTLGAPTNYVVRLYELGNSSGNSTLLARGTFRTPLRTFTIPPGLMLPGVAYVFSISAVRNTGVSAAEYPLKTQLPYSSAPMMSAIVAP